MSDYIIGEEIPDLTRDDVSYEDVIESLAELAFGSCADNAHDMADTNVEDHVATSLSTYVDVVLDTFFAGHEGEYNAEDQTVYLAARTALFGDVLEATYDYAEDNGYNVYVPREKVK